jgi:hypothetical protein
MTHRPIDLKFAQVSTGPVGRVNSIRLVSDNRNPVIAALASSDNDSAIVRIPLSGGPARPLFPLAWPFGTPDWDIFETPSGLSVVWTQPGSAACSLALTSLKDTAVITGRYPGGVFQSPRFVRGALAPSVTAVAYRTGEHFLALFPNLAGRESEYVSLPPAGSGVPQDA